MEREPATFLPEHIRDVLKRKSSRDPASRFPKKLHLLLSYVSDLPTLEDQVGLAWTSEDEFKMNKSTLADVMGIKLNTLNVNLRDLKFQQLQRDKDGWTRWKRSGFTRATNGIDAEGDLPASPRRPPVQSDAGFVGRSPSVPFVLGKLTDPQNERFLTDSHRLWTEVLQCSPTSPVPTDVAIERAATRFRYPEQPLQNAKEVVEAIIRPSSSDSKLIFTDFCRFLAMFGPERTIMLKIASLLTCSNATGKWLTFDRTHATARPPFAYFETSIPNCLSIHHADNTHEKVYNVPTLESGGDGYLIDEYGKQYKDWDDWFGQHPIKHQQQSYAILAYP
jgi:hypothetical protein